MAKALQEQIVDIQIAKGANEWIDPRAMLSPGQESSSSAAQAGISEGGAPQFENYVVDYQGAVRKRPGYGALTKTIAAIGGNIGAIRKLDTRGDDLVAVSNMASRQNHPQLYSAVNSTVGTWVPKAPMVPCSLTRTPRVRPRTDSARGSHVHSVFAQDGAGGGQVVTSWNVGGSSASLAGNRMRIDNAITGACTAPDFAVTAPDGGGNTFQIASCQCGTSRTIVANLVFQPGLGLTLTRLDCTASYPGVAIALILTASTTAIYWDLCWYSGNTVVVAWVDSATTNIIVKTVDITTGTVLATDTIGGARYALALALNADASGTNIILTWYDGTNVKAKCYNSSLLAVQFAAYSVAAPVSGANLNLSCYVDSTGAGAVYMDCALLTAGETGIHRQSFTSGGANTGAVSSLFRAHLHGRPFSYNGTEYMTVYNRDSAIAGNNTIDPRTVPSIVLVAPRLDSATTWLPMGLMAHNEAYPQNVAASITSLPLVTPSRGLTASQFYFGIPVITGLDSGGGLPNADYPIGGVDTVFIDFDETTSQGALWHPAKIQRNTVFSGALTSSYDGSNVTECGFLQEPEFVSGSVVALGGAITGGNYYYSFVYAYTDAAGNLTYSRPSPPNKVVLSANDLFSAKVTTCTITRRGRGDDSTQRPVYVLMYRTIAGGGAAGTMYLTAVSSTAGSTTNAAIPSDATKYSVTLSDSFSDTSIATSATLYTNGGVLTSDPAPPTRSLLAIKNRLFALSGEDDRKVVYTRQPQNGEMPQWSDALFFRVEDSPEPLTALANIDDTIIVFSKNRIWLVSGDGPNDLGQGGVFSAPRLVTFDTGCVDPRGCAAHDGGLLFYSANGFKLIDRSGIVKDAGVNVLDTTTTRWNRLRDQVAVSPLRRRITWLMHDSAGVNGQGWVTYDYGFDIWYTGTSSAMSSIGGQTALNSTHFLGDVGGVYAQGVGATPGLDPSTTYQGGTLKTAWFHIAGIQGFQRIWEAQIQCKRLSPCTLTVKVYVDYDDVNVAETHVFNLETTTSVVNAAFPQILMPIKNQKCAAIRFVLTDSLYRPNGLASNPVGLDISTLSLRVGLKTGGNKLPASNYG